MLRDKNAERVAFVTGAGRGIGLAIIERLATSGVKIVAHAHSDESLARLEALRAAGRIQRVIRADLRDATESTTMSAALGAGEYGDIDILVNNAGIYGPIAPFADVRIHELLATMQTNFVAPFQLVQAAICGMLGRGWGRILNISSIGVKYGGGSRSVPYTCSKASLETLTLALARKHAGRDVLINALRVGATATDFHAADPDKDLCIRSQQIPIGRMASPTEIADFASYLVSPSNTYITGSIIPIAGGE